MIALPRSLMIVAAIILTVIAFLAIVFGVALVYHGIFGSLAGNA
jgi:hypothetical protein